MSHTFLIEVREFNLETYCFQDFFLDSLIVRRAFARKIRLLFKFSCVGRLLNCRSAPLRCLLAVLQSSVNQGFLAFFDFVAVFGTVSSAILIRINLVGLKLGPVSFV